MTDPAGDFIKQLYDRTSPLSTVEAARPRLRAAFADVEAYIDALNREIVELAQTVDELRDDYARCWGENERLKELLPDKPQADVDAERVEDAYHAAQDAEQEALMAGDHDPEMYGEA